MELFMKIDEYVSAKMNAKIEKKGLFKKVYYLPTGSRMRSYKRYVKESDLIIIKECLRSGDFSNILNVNPEVSANAMLHVLISDDRKAFLVQLFEYEACCPVPSTEPLLVEDGQVGFMQRFLKL